MTNSSRIAIVGAASIRGKQLSETLADSTFAAANILLLDDEQALGQLETVGDEITFIQPVSADSFDRVDFTFFSDKPELAQKHWAAAQRAGSSIIDLTGGLEKEAGVLVYAPWVHEAMGEAAPQGSTPTLRTPAIVSAHPAALVCALLMNQMQQAGAVHLASATIFEPASEYGRGALDELHQQTVSLLSLQPVPKAIYDIQVAFNAVAAFGEAAKADLGLSEATMRRHYALLSGGRLPQLALQLVHVPVFHGYTLSIAVEFDRPVTLDQVEAALAGSHIDVIVGDTDLPSNLSSIGEHGVSVRARLGEANAAQSRLVWLWASADNLELSALNAVECAQELRRLRPQGQVQ